MKIPSHVKIGAQDWTVEFTDAVETTDDCGAAMAHKQIIYISNNLCRQQQEQTFLHELLHACVAFSGAGAKDNFTEEEFVSFVEAPLYTVLTENGLTPDE